MCTGGRSEWRLRRTARCWCRMMARTWCIGCRWLSDGKCFGYGLAWGLLVLLLLRPIFRKTGSLRRGGRAGFGSFFCLWGGEERGLGFGLGEGRGGEEGRVRGGPGHLKKKNIT